MPHTVRRAVPADVADITECYLRSWRAAYADDLVPDVLAAEADKRRRFDWAAGMVDDTVAVFVACDGDRIVGVAQADLHLPAPRDLPEVTMLYVDPSAWGTGAAAGLLDAVAGWIGGSGNGEARLRVVEAHHRARRFYEKHGWVVDHGMAPDSNDFFPLIYYRRQLPRP